MEKATEIVKAFMSPCEKLIAAIQAAIGKAYEPRYIRRKADAEAYEIATVGKALRESSDIPITYSKGELTMDTSNYDEFVKRTQNRLAVQELQKQKNIEDVTDLAYEELLGEEDVPDVPVDSDWMNRFFNSVEDVSNEQMQRIWAKLLAGEVKRPNTFSLRTLHVLKNLTQYEADLFKRVCVWILRCPGNAEKSIDDYFVLSGFVEKSDEIEFITMQLLEDAGLFSVNTFVCIGFNLGPGESEYIRGIEHSIKMTNTGKDNYRIERSAYFLTNAGKELYSLIEKDCFATTEYFELVISELRKGEYNSLPDEVVMEIVETDSEVNNI